MSVRFHRTAPLLTFYHNPKSPQSLVALSILRKAQSGSSVTEEVSASSSTEKATEAIAGEDVEPLPVGRGEQFLIDAASDPGNALELDLEVKERSKEPPTQAQIQTILDYLKGSASLSLNTNSANAKDTHPAAMGSSRGTPRPGQFITRVKQMQSQSAAPSAWAEVDSSSIVDQLKNSDLLLVDWENGRAATNLDGVKALLALLKKEQDDPSLAAAQSQSTGGSCLVM